MRTPCICFLCWLPSGYTGIDKRGAPFFRCGGCGTAVFTKSQGAWGRVMALIEQARTEAAAEISSRMSAALAAAPPDPFTTPSREIQSVEKKETSHAAV